MHHTPCVICGKEIYAFKSLNRKFCSRECYYKSRVGRLEDGTILTVNEQGRQCCECLEFKPWSEIVFRKSCCGPCGDKLTRYYNRGRKRLTRGLERESQAPRPRPRNCEICGKPDPRRALCFDHDHSTGKFRGWLCYACNLALGYAKDDTAVLKNMIQYLDAFAASLAQEEAPKKVATVNETSLALLGTTG